MKCFHTHFAILKDLCQNNPVMWVRYVFIPFYKWGNKSVSRVAQEELQTLGSTAFPRYNHRSYSARRLRLSSVQGTELWVNSKEGLRNPSLRQRQPIASPEAHRLAHNTSRLFPYETKAPTPGPEARSHTEIHTTWFHLGESSNVIEKRECQKPGAWEEESEEVSV